MGWEGEEVYRAGVGVLTGWVVAWPSHVCPLALLPGLVLDPPKEAASPSLEEPFSHVQTLCPIFLLPFTSNSALLTLSPLLCLGLLLRLQPSPWYLTVPFPSSSQDSPGESVMPPHVGVLPSRRSRGRHSRHPTEGGAAVGSWGHGGSWLPALAHHPGTLTGPMGKPICLPSCSWGLHTLVTLGPPFPPLHTHMKALNIHPTLTEHSICSCSSHRASAPLPIHICLLSWSLTLSLMFSSFAHCVQFKHSAVRVSCIPHHLSCAFLAQCCGLCGVAHSLCLMNTC
jgi:hypothetical protein